MLKIILLILIPAFLTSCFRSQESAPIEYKNGEARNTITRVPKSRNNGAIVSRPLHRDHEYNNTEGVLNEKVAKEAPATIVINDNESTSSIIYHEVQKDETLDQISKKYNCSKEQIIEVNHLEPPFILKEFQIIKLKLDGNKPEATADSIKADAAIIKLKDFINPTKGTITHKFDISSGNAGIIILAAENSSVHSVADGVVIKAFNNSKYGNTIIVETDIDTKVAYAHLKELILTAGQKVTQNQVIGHVGKSGAAEAPQLYFAIKKVDKYVDPLLYIPGF